MEELKPDAPKEVKDEKEEPKKEEPKKEEPVKGGKTILMSRMGQETKCSKEAFQSFIDAGWKEVK